MQGVADSLVYAAADSTIHFFTNPVLWSDENQITADSIRMLLKNKKIDKLYMIANAFVASQDSLKISIKLKGEK
ncbi:MAG: hypothetical protein U5K54_02125 [Cytophagales bacterium]|nr:hypothetical protein [Cytophagales bacterium]